MYGYKEKLDSIFGLTESNSLTKNRLRHMDLAAIRQITRDEWDNIVSPPDVVKWKNLLDDIPYDDLQELLAELDTEESDRDRERKERPVIVPSYHRRPESPRMPYKD